VTPHPKRYLVIADDMMSSDCIAAFKSERAARLRCAAESMQREAAVHVWDTHENRRVTTCDFKRGAR
jgi:hypothetical protein